jgi:hypothetical protein
LRPPFSTMIVAVNRQLGEVVWSDGSVSPVLYAWDASDRPCKPRLGIKFAAHNRDGQLHIADYHSSMSEFWTEHPS